MSEPVSMVQQRRVMQAEVQSVSELRPDISFMSIQMRLMSTRPNLNGEAVTEAFIGEIVGNQDKYLCMPLCADVSRMLQGQESGYGHLYDKERGVFLTQQIGSFYSFNQTQDEYGTSLIGEARIPKRRTEICQTMLSLYLKGELFFSFEILVSELTERDGLSIIDASEGNRLIGMAMVSIPAYPEAKPLAFVAEAQEAMEMEAEAETSLDTGQDNPEENKEEVTIDMKVTKTNTDVEQAMETLVASALDTSGTAPSGTGIQTIEVAETAPIAKAEQETGAPIDLQVNKQVIEAMVAPLRVQLASALEENTRLKAEQQSMALDTKRTALVNKMALAGLPLTEEEMQRAIDGMDYSFVVDKALDALIEKEMRQKKEPAPTVQAALYAEDMMVQKPYGGLLEKANQ